MDKIKLDSFIDVYLIGSLSSLNIRLDHTDKKSVSVMKKNIAIEAIAINEKKIRFESTNGF